MSAPSMQLNPQTLYAYVDGSDLDEVAEALEDEFRVLAEEPGWVCGRPTVVNQKTPVANARAGDLPYDWDLGLNLVLPELDEADSGWFADVQRIALHLAKLHSAYDRDFVIGLADSATGISEDVFFVDSAEPDLGLLRGSLGPSPVR